MKLLFLLLFISIGYTLTDDNLGNSEDEIIDSIVAVLFSEPDCTPTGIIIESEKNDSLTFKWEPNKALCDNFSSWIINCTNIDTGLDFVPEGCENLDDYKKSSCIAIGLESNTFYAYQVAGEYANDSTITEYWSNFSKPVSTLPNPLPNPAQAPTNVTASNPTENSLDVSWKAGNQSDCNFASWNVTCVKGCLNSPDGCTDLTVYEKTRCVAINLIPDTEYSFLVKEICKDINANSASNNSNILKTRKSSSGALPKTALKYSIHINLNETVTDPLFTSAFSKDFVDSLTKSNIILYCSLNRVMTSLLSSQKEVGVEILPRLTLSEDTTKSLFDEFKNQIENWDKSKLNSYSNTKKIDVKSEPIYTFNTIELTLCDNNEYHQSCINPEPGTEDNNNWLYLLGALMIFVMMIPCCIWYRNRRDHDSMEDQSIISSIEMNAKASNKRKPPWSLKSPYRQIEDEYI